MALLETKHTLSRVNKIKRDLLKTISIISYFSMIVFLAYYVYLAIQNLHEYFYLAIYSCLIVVILSLFIIELSIKEDKKLLKNEKRLVAEKKRRSKTCVKIFKFIVKSILIGVAIYETVTNFNLSLSNIINIGSAIMLVVQILLEIIIHYIIKQIDYFRLSTELDFEESNSIIKKIFNMLNPMRGLEEDAIKASQGMRYSAQELKMIDDIKKEAELYVKDREEKEKLLKQICAEPKKKAKKPFMGKIFKKK